MSPQFDPFFKGYPPSFPAGIQVTANAIKTANHFARALWEEYLERVREWKKEIARYGRDFQDTQDARTAAYLARVSYMTKCRWINEAPRGSKYCNLSTNAQKRMN